MWISIFFLFASFGALAQVREIQSGLSFFEKNTITVEHLGRSPASCENCDNEGDQKLDLSFYSEEPSSDHFESSDFRHGSLFMQYTLKDSTGMKPTGFEFTMTGPNQFAGAPLATGCNPACQTLRRWQMISKKGSKRETFLMLTDDAGSGFLSQQMESVIVLLPRRNRPHIQTTRSEFHVILPTGEKVIFDKETKLIKSGVLKEGPIDLNPNRHQRQFAPITYNGKGIMIRADKRGGDPRVDGQTALVTQHGKSCEVPVKDLWAHPSADFKYSDDSKLVQYLNTKCPGKFRL